MSVDSRSENCATRLVALFGSQAEVARQLQLDRAVVSHWIKVGYVPARWGTEIELATDGRITASEIVAEASSRKPIKLKSRPDGEGPFGSTLQGSDTMSLQYAPSKRITSFHPPQRTLMGPGPTEIHPRVLTTMSQPAIAKQVPG
jgi:DNA-binding transcriptional regulator YdaS (Cro superfamily)